MSPTPERFEAMLIAHRKTLAALVAGLAPDHPAHERLTELSVVQLSEEDPGADPGGAFSIEAGIAEEIRLILEASARVSKG